jgi:SH3 domain-containing protein
MTFDEAERKFRDLQARVQRGEPISRADYEAMVAELAVQDDRGVLWEINPRTGKWMYFDGAEWVVGRPPGHDQSTVMPITQAMQPPGATPPPMPRPQFTAATAPRPPAPTPTGAAPPPMPKSQIAPPPPRPTTTQPAQARPAGATPAPMPRPGAPTAAPRPAPPGSPPPPESVGAPRPGGGLQGALRTSPLGGSNREWIPLAIGAVVLLLCAATLFAGSILLTGGGPFGGPPRTPTRLLSQRTNTPALPSPFPTATLPPPTPAPVLAKINVASANVRAGPSTTAKIVTTLKNGTQITLVGRTADSQWFQINVAGQAAPAWISIQVFQIASGDPNSLPVAGAAATPTKQSIAPQPPAAAQFTPTPTVIGAPTATPTS